MLHRLRITAAIACLLATACFTILWMRSVRQWDSCIYCAPSTGMLHVGSANEMFSFGRVFPQASGEFVEEHRRLTWVSRFRANSERQPLLPKLVRSKWSDDVYIPYWLLIVSSGLFGTAIYVNRPVRFAFSLRALAVVATLIAITLGLGVAASRLSLG